MQRKSLFFFSYQSETTHFCLSELSELTEKHILTKYNKLCKDKSLLRLYYSG